MLHLTKNLIRTWLHRYRNQSIQSLKKHPPELPSEVNVDEKHYSESTYRLYHLFQHYHVKQ